MRRSLFSSLAALALVAAAQSSVADTVVTLDGRTVDGDSRILPDGGGAFLISQRGGQPLTIPFNNVLYATVSLPAQKPPVLGDVGSLSAHSVGDVHLDADAFFSRGFYALRGGGAGLNGVKDGMQFFAKGLYGNGEVTARIMDVSSGEVGVTFRDEMDANAIHVSLVANAKGELMMRYRPDIGARTAQISAGKVTYPAYIRLSRSDRQFRAFTSNDGKAFELAARLYDDSKPQGADEKPRGVQMDTGSLAGLVLAGGTLDAPAAAMVEQMTIRGLYDTAPTPPRPEPAKFAGGLPELSRAGVQLHTGTFLSKATLTTEEGKLVITRGTQKIPVERADLASVRMREIPAAMLARLPEKPVGLLLAAGDFMDGDITALDQDRVEVNNITLGLSTYRLDVKVNAIYFRDASTTPGGYRVRLHDGSVIVARAVRVEGDQFVLEDYLLGTLKFPIKEVLSLQGAADRATSLLTLRPSKVEGPAGSLSEAMTYADSAASFWLQGTLGRYEQGIVAPAGTAATFRPPGGAARFIAGGMVPQRLPSGAAVHFIVEADGKQVFKSAALTSQSAPIRVDVPLQQAKALTLRVESAGEQAIPAFGVWTLPILMK